ncbi:MAG TPA: porin [Tepidisphaeraceae bacterium]|nr:porin [Tepidisphaeraceae bacterium]
MVLRGFIATSLGLLIVGRAGAQVATDRLAQLEARVQSLESELKQYRQTDAATVEKVMADAKARSGGIGAGKVGYNNGFFLADDTNNFQMKVNALLQTRYIYNHGDPNNADDKDESGFQSRRAEIYLTGNAFNPSLIYQFGGGFDRGTGGFTVVSAYAGYQLDKATELRAGIFKGPFMVEELTNAGKQQSPERSLVNTLFTVGITEGAQIQYSKDNYRLAVMAHDGTSAMSTDFASDKTDIAVAARGEIKLAGDWSQFTDFNGWKDSKFAARLGLGVDYEVGETGDSASNPNMLKYTADLTIKNSGWNLFFEGAGKHQNDNGTGSGALDQYGLLAQGGVFVIPNRAEIFGRYEYIFLDGMFNTSPSVDDDLNLVDVGFNWYFLGHNAKITTDVIYLFDAIPAGGTALGLVPSADGPQFVFRTGFYLMF